MPRCMHISTKTSRVTPDGARLLPFRRACSPLLIAAAEIEPDRLVAAAVNRTVPVLIAVGVEVPVVGGDGE